MYVRLCHYSTDIIESYILLEQYRPLFHGRWHGVRYKSYARRTRRRMDIRCSRRPLHSGLSLTVRRDPVGSLMATATSKNESVVSVPLANEALSAAAGWDKIAHLRYFPSPRLPFWNQLRYIPPEYTTRYSECALIWVRRTPRIPCTRGHVLAIFLWVTIQSMRLLMHYQYKDVRYSNSHNSYSQF